MAQCVVIFITNHSHDETGDIYMSLQLCDMVMTVSSFLFILVTFITAHLVSPGHPFP